MAMNKARRALLRSYARTFLAHRATRRFRCGPEIRTQVRLLQTKYEHIIVDVGGRDTASLRAALTVASILLVPVLPATFDVWSLEPLDDLIQEAREINSGLCALVVLNAADARGQDNEEAAIIIREKGSFEYFPHPIIRRKAFRNAAAAGLSVLECQPSDEKAIREFTLLANHLFGYAGDIASISYGNRKASSTKDKDQRRASREIHYSDPPNSVRNRVRRTVYPDPNSVSQELVGSDRLGGKKTGLESK